MDSASSPDTTPQTFRELATRIAAQDLPAFGLTLREVFQATESETASGQQIAEVVLRDPALTSRVLRAANAAHLGMTGQAKVVTVSRAIVVLGLNPIRSLCVSALTVEAMEHGTKLGHRVQQSLGRALHAAVQARDMGLRQRQSKAEAEQLFVEALLSSVGELAFWCFGAAFATRLDEALRAGQSAEAAENAVLGTTLRQFGRDLLQTWKLDAVLRDSREVALARRVSVSAGAPTSPGGGWHEPAMQQAVHAVALLLGQNDQDTLARLRSNASDALELAQALGAHEAARSIPAVGDTQADAAQPLPDPYPKADLQQQLRALTEMGHVARTRRDLPILLETCLEGLHRTVGLDRCALCLLNPARTRLAARMVIGPGSETLREDMQCDWNAGLDQRAQGLSPSWVRDARSRPEFLHGLPTQREFLIAPFFVDQQLIGFIYADRAPSERPLSPEQLESFQCFVAQAQIVARGLAR